LYAERGEKKEKNRTSGLRVQAPESKPQNPWISWSCQNLVAQARALCCGRIRDSAVALQPDPAKDLGIFRMSGVGSRRCNFFQRSGGSGKKRRRPAALELSWRGCGSSARSTLGRDLPPSVPVRGIHGRSLSAWATRRRLLPRCMNQGSWPVFYCFVFLSRSAPRGNWSLDSGSWQVMRNVTARSVLRFRHLA